jgi:hypothetical protein
MEFRGPATCAYTAEARRARRFFPSTVVTGAEIWEHAKIGAAS